MTKTYVTIKLIKRVSAALVVEMGTTPLTSNDQFSVTLKEFYHVKGDGRK